MRKWKDDVVQSAKVGKGIEYGIVLSMATDFVIATTTQSNNTTSNANSEQTTPRRSSAASSTAASPKSPTSENGPPRTIKSDDVKYQSTGNGPRDKTIELMYSAVALGSYAGEYLQVDS